MKPDQTVSPTLNYDADEDVERRVADFKQAWPEGPAQNLLDLHFYFFDEFEKLAKKALENGQGLFVAF